LIGLRSLCTNSFDLPFPSFQVFDVEQIPALELADSMGLPGISLR